MASRSRLLSEGLYLLVSVLHENTSEARPEGFVIGTASERSSYVPSRRRGTWIIGLYVVSVSATTVAWLAGIGWVATRLVRYALL